MLTIYQTQHNSDMTEGRGPMSNGPSFLIKKHAEEYIDAQPGIMGRRAKWSQEKFGDWQIKEIEVHEQSLIDLRKEQERNKKTALEKLSANEIEALKTLGLE